MEIKLSGHSFEYEITGMSQLFFPGEPVLFTAHPQANQRLYSKLIQGQAGLVATAAYYADKHRWRGRCPVRQQSREGTLLAVKHAIYRALQEATGITPPWGILTGIKPTGIYERLLEANGPAETRRILLEDYCLQPEKIPLLHQICKVKETVQTDPKKEASLYLSIPFCPTRCAYCSFISVTAAGSNRLVEPYLTGLLQEMRQKTAVLRRHGRTIRSVYVGGGTPGILTEEQLERLLLGLCKELGPLQMEFTFELGRPDTVTIEKLRLLKSYGVTRLCINTQTTNDQVLAAVGRRHTRAQYLEAVSLTKKLEFDSINTDLIAGLPGESAASFASSLEDVLAAGVDHITIHTLSIKRSAKLHETHDYFDPRNDQVQRMLDGAFRRLLGAGFVPYYMYRQKNTVSNGENVGFAKPDKIGLYNLYMMEDLHTVAACGAGASSKVIGAGGGRIERIINVKYPLDYVQDYEKVEKNTALLDRKLEEIL